MIRVGGPSPLWVAPTLSKDGSGEEDLAGLLPHGTVVLSAKMLTFCGPLTFPNAPLVSQHHEHRSLPSPVPFL